MPAFSTFVIKAEDNSIKDVIGFLEENEFKVKRTKNISGYDFKKEKGYQIVGTDVTISDPEKNLGFIGSPVLIQVFNPTAASGLQKNDPEGSKKLFSKLKRKFQAKF